MTTFFLIRHASCNGLGRTLWGRTAGVCLNEKGQLQAQRLANRFSGITLQAIYSSPLERAVETAETIARTTNLEVIKSPAFDEIDFGEWTGKSLESLSSDERWRRFNTYRSATRIPGGESFLEVQNRTVRELDALASQYGRASVAIVSHADVIKAAVGYFSATPIDLLDRIEISPCSISVVAMDGDVARLLTINNRCNLTQLWG
ncbi:MAG TPA: histidine phosphatase family protein [Pyrinomonadaceae bacterium]|nr:histidine phosphatase family protein [Pyrinomonadaceae bacterium]